MNSNTSVKTLINIIFQTQDIMMTSFRFEIISNDKKKSSNTKKINVIYHHGKSQFTKEFNSLKYKVLRHAKALIKGTSRNQAKIKTQDSITEYV